ncbi:family A G protein-coupled receptor-like protein [Conidiobolus coronatus NRRL 28638]|uniref:Family A G protein-coupled receptor-like protein n=1 Tax=Conidiobolus coronatus (strain ATCC 28846 / CBS 209.66 / NRRL 28638) TaxID=796925 RepID=A0A137PJ01_CONC2|nr:family A G protein-coupled receptor-like protein [Conidiobolus coronatus NRRL 28638]|eukprot:KXN74969.1 family A G protein-coupled receptor-like protein [Conidiobolus coronatus NRRL 28638]
MGLNNLDDINVIFSSILLILSIFILSFTGLIIYIILAKISSKSTEIKVLLVLCLVEIELSLSKAVTCILKLTYGKEANNTGTYLCYYIGFEHQLIARVELMVVAYLSLMRYFIVCHNITKSTKFWLISLAVGCLPSLMIFIYGATLHQDKSSPSYLACTAFSAPTQINFIINCILPFLFIIPSWIITFCYFCIGLKINKQLNRMKIEAIADRDYNLLKVISLQKIKIVVQLTLVIVLYNINFSPSYITLILKFTIGYNRTPIAEAIVFLVVYCTFSLNPVLTITFQPELNHELSLILFKLNLRIKKLYLTIFE